MLDADSTKNIEAPRFAKVLKGREVIALSFGAMIGWSWVVLTGAWIGSAGTMGAITAFVIGGVAILLISLIYAELASALPFAGGEHVIPSVHWALERPLSAPGASFSVMHL